MFLYSGGQTNCIYIEWWTDKMYQYNGGQTKCFYIMVNRQNVSI